MTSHDPTEGPPEDLTEERPSTATTDDPVAELLRSAGPRPRIPDADLAAIKGAFEASWLQHLEVRSEHRRSRVRALSLLAATLLALVAGVWIFRDLLTGLGQPALGQVVALAGEARISSADGSVGVVQLGRRLAPGDRLEVPEQTSATPFVSLDLGGYSVRIDGGSEVVLEAERVLRLAQGALYIDTGLPNSGPGDPGSVDSDPGDYAGRGPAAGVEVRTPIGSVFDIGTQFEVRLLEDSSLRVRVREGEVRIDVGAKVHTASAGEELLVASTGEVAAADLGAAVTWDWVLRAAPPFEIEGHTVQELLDWVAHETGWSVRFASGAAASTARSAILRGAPQPGLRPDQTPFVLLQTAGLQARLEDGELVVEQISR